MSAEKTKGIPKPPPFKLRKAAPPPVQAAEEAAPPLPIAELPPEVASEEPKEEASPAVDEIHAEVAAMPEPEATEEPVAESKTEPQAISEPSVEPEVVEIQAEPAHNPLEVKTDIMPEESISENFDLPDDPPSEHEQEQEPAEEEPEPEPYPEPVVKVRESASDLESVGEEIKIYDTEKEHHFEERPAPVRERAPALEAAAVAVKEDDGLQLITPEYKPGDEGRSEPEAEVFDSVPGPVKPVIAAGEMPIRLESGVVRQERCEVKSGEGAKTFYGTDDSEITVYIDNARQEWRLLLVANEHLKVGLRPGEALKLPQEYDFVEGILYDKKGSTITAQTGDTFAFSPESSGWKLSLLALKEIPLRGVSEMNLGGKSGIILGPKATSLVFFNGGTLRLEQTRHGDYRPPAYDEPKEAEASRKKSFVFSVYHENTYFEGDDEVDTVCLECENGTYGWNVNFENGLFMSVNDLIEYQVRNHALPDDSGIIYHGANRLEFAKVKGISVYKKPFYYGYGVE